MRKLLDLLPAILSALDSKHTRRIYQSCILAFVEWHDERNPLSKAIVQTYIRHLRENEKSSASCNLALAALRKLAAEAEEHGLISRGTAASIREVPAIIRRGVRTGNWLTREQANTLIHSCDISDLKGLRDRVMLDLLLQAGLRREEAASLDVRQIQVREGRWVIVNLLSKGGRTRTIPLNTETARHIEAWMDAAGIDTGHHGPLLRCVNKHDQALNRAMTASAIYKQVRQLTLDALGVEIKPHDLRRTFGKLARKGGAPLDQIQQTLGHSSPTTTQIYLGEYQDLENAPCDVLRLDGDKEPK